MPKLSLLEIFLIEFVFFALLWLVDDYIASMLTVVISSICFFILILSLIAEWIEKSKVPKSYYIIMFISTITPWIVTGAFVFFAGVDFDWLKKP